MNPEREALNALVAEFEIARWQFESAVEQAALEVTAIAKQISSAIGDVSIVEAKQVIIREFIARL
jgi:hypothetical protein